jgi:hypothetical protein
MSIEEILGRTAVIVLLVIFVFLIAALGFDFNMFSKLASAGPESTKEICLEQYNMTPITSMPAKCLEFYK